MPLVGAATTEQAPGCGPLAWHVAWHGAGHEWKGQGMDVLREPDERHERDRTVVLTWRTGVMVEDVGSRHGEVVVSLDVSHDRYGKRYVASLRRSTESDGWVRYTFGDGVQVYSEPCARFSRKGLLHAQLAAWDVVRTYEGGHALVRELVALANREPVAV